MLKTEKTSEHAKTLNIAFHTDTKLVHELN